MERKTDGMDRRGLLRTIGGGSAAAAVAAAPLVAAPTPAQAYDPGREETRARYNPNGADVKAFYQTNGYETLKK